MVINKLMFSIEDHKKYTIYLKPPVESLIYEKPKGRNGLIYTIFILVLSIVSLQLILMYLILKENAWKENPESVLRDIKHLGYVPPPYNITISPRLKGGR